MAVPSGSAMGGPALATPLPATNEASNEPVWGLGSANNPGSPKPADPTDGAAPDTPAGANAGSAPGIDIPKAKEAMLQKADEILKRSYEALGLEYKPPATHLDRVTQAITVSKKLSGKDLDGFLRAMESAGKDFGINFGLSRGTGKQATALNLGDAAFKGVDGAKRQQVRNDLFAEMTPKATATSTPQADAGKPLDDGSATPAAGDKQLATLKQSVLQQWPALGVADKAAYNRDEVKKIASHLDAANLPDGLKGAAPAIKAGLMNLVSQAKGQEVKKDDLVDLIAKALLAELERKKTE